MNFKNYSAEVSEPIQRFLSYCLSVRGKSEKTVAEYFKDIRTFFRFYKRSKGYVSPDVQLEDIPIKDVDLDIIKSVTLHDALEYMSYLNNVKGNNAATRSRKTSSLRTFYSYLHEYNFIDENPMINLHLPKKSKKLPRYLTLEQSMELLSSVDGEFKERNYCILTLFLNCGLRLQELVNINYNDIKSDNTIIVRGKGDKERVIYLNEACVDAIERYKKVRPRDGLKDRSALFISRQMNRISPIMVQKLVHKHLDKIGLSSQDGYSCHKLRHTAATLMYQTGKVDVRVLKEILGHENLSTTEIYTHVSDNQMEKASKANPLSDFKKKN